jgi:DNA segregation ATPase FtsK/SpoIIIE, S-DNA-T family
MNVKRNQFKNQDSEKKKPEKSFSSSFNFSFGILKNEKVEKITALFLLLSSFYLLLAFTSYIFTWKADQDKIFYSAWDLLFNSELVVENWLGKLGAVVAHLFVHNGFGIAAFLFSFLAFISGFKILTGISLVPIKKSIRYSFFALIFTSLSLGYLLGDSIPYLGGAFGFHASKWLVALTGSAGTGLLLIFILLTAFVISFNLSFSWLGKLFTPSSSEENQTDDEELELKGNKIKEFTPKEEDLSNAIIELEDSETTGESPTVIELSEVPLKTSSLELINEIKEIIQSEPVHESRTPEVDMVIEAPVETNEVPVEDIQHNHQLGEYDPTLDLRDYKFPHLDLLEKYGSSQIVINKAELEANKDKIVETLKNYNIAISQIKATVGPTVTLYEIIPEAGVRISKIKNLEDDIALSLSALGIRIIAPIPGKGTIGIEVPNQKAEVVAMRNVIGSEKFMNTDMDLPIALGKTISNETFIADLAKMPHLLMAGATGQGKSVGLNAILVSLLYKKHPSQIKFVLVDPKKVELTLFNKIERHFLAKLPGEEEPIITDTKKVVNTLNSLCIEMDNRYELLKDAHVRNIKEYNTKFIARKLNPEKGHKFLPYIILVVDEFADLIMTAGREVETPIARLAQLARAIGIHLIIATQRPSVNIITGTIKANFPARIAFRVSSRIDSRTILDSGGADQLIGRGDMLLSTGNDLIRIQCAFVDTPEVEAITDFIGSQRAYPEAHLLPEYIGEGDEAGGGKDIDPSDRDAFFMEAARIVVQHQQGSASLLQRKLKLGYNRAGRIIDQLEAAGIIGPFEGSKARKVNYQDESSLEQYLKHE